MCVLLFLCVFSKMSFFRKYERNLFYVTYFLNYLSYLTGFNLVKVISTLYLHLKYQTKSFFLHPLVLKTRNGFLQIWYFLNVQLRKITYLLLSRMSLWVKARHTVIWSFLHLHAQRKTLICKPRTFLFMSFRK